MIPWRALTRATSAAQTLAAPAADWVTRGDQRLDDSAVERLALALHERRHGSHQSERGEAACARLSGAYDDVYAIEPVILELMRGAL